MNKIMLGFNYGVYVLHGIKMPIYASLQSHLIVVGGSGSGKSMAILYWMYKARNNKLVLFICDFKASKEFAGISEHFGRSVSLFQYWNT